MAKLNERGIYVTPARPIKWDFLLITWKMGQITYYRQPEKFGGKNYPANYGRAKELAPESEFEFFIIHRDTLTLPRWIRLGKWASKALVETEKSVQINASNGIFVSACPLNPLDLPHLLIVYDVISMPPVSLVNNARLNGEHYVLDEKTKLPAGMKYTFPA
jgi:CRISPR-associated protein Csc1